MRFSEKPMKNSAIITLSLLSILTLSEITVAQSQTTSTDKTDNAKQSIKRARVDPAGFISLPDGFKIIRTKSWVDAWFGYIESSAGKFKISFGAGLVESFFDKYKKNFLWTKTEGNQNPTKIGLMRIKKVKTFVARIGWIEFSAPIKQKGDKEIFLEIVRSYNKNP